MFFVISGYCIAERCTREYAVTGSVRGFLTDRLLRIYPPYWAALAFAILLNVAGAVVRDQAFVPGNPWPAGALGWLRAFGAVEFWSGDSGYLLVAWTLSFELGFYLLAAACLGLALRTRRVWAGWVSRGGGPMLAVGLSPWGSALPLLTLWPNFALGAIVWWLRRHLPHAPARLAVGLPLLAVLAFFVWKFLPDDNLTLVLMVAYAALLLVLRPWDAQIADAAWLRWLGWMGIFSYSLYLVHAPIVGKFRNLLGRRWAAAGSPFPLGAGGGLRAGDFGRLVLLSAGRTAHRKMAPGISDPFFPPETVMKTCDFLVIGGGSAGYNAARVASGLGLKTIVVDGARELGGLCILRGCMPSKTLLYIAEVLHLAQKGKSFGLKTSLRACRPEGHPCAQAEDHRG